MNKLIYWFKAKVFYQVFNKNNKRDLTKSTKFSIYRIFKRLRISIFPITSRYHPYGLDKFELIEKIKKLETSEDIYFEKRDTQKELSKIESYRLICETFLKFIPPALLSLIISLAIIIPATGQLTEFNMINIIILLLSIVGLFIICWRLLILFLDKIYEKSTFIEALEDRRKEILKIKKYTK